MYITREDLEVLEFTTRCLGCWSLLKGTARQAHTENCRKRNEEGLRGTVKAEAAQGRVKEQQDKAAKRETKRTRTNLEEGQAQTDRGETVQTEEDAPTTTTISSSSKQREFVRCRLLAGDFEPRREGPREDLFAAMPPLEAKKALFASQSSSLGVVWCDLGP